jgi:outer membrane protein OmpA-like peptidoglycan-associated protein
MLNRLGPLLCLALIVGSASALPGVLGLRGLYRVIDARTPGEFTYSASMSFLYQTALLPDTVQFSPSGYPDIDTTLSINDREYYGDAYLQFGMGLPMGIEAALTAHAQINNYEYDQVYPRGDFVGMMDVLWGLTDVTLAGKYSYPLKDWLTTGGAFFVSLPVNPAIPDTAADYDGFWDRGEFMLQVRRPFLGTGKLAYGLYGLLTAVHPTYGEAYMNLGYASYGLEFEDDPQFGPIDTRDGAIEFALGADYPTEMIIPFAEFWMRAFLTRSSSAYSMPMALLGGIRLVDHTNGAYVDAAGQIGLTSFDKRESDPLETGEPPLPGGVPASWGFMIALGFDSDLFQTAEGGSGTVSGTVTDAESGQGVSATISFPGSTIPSITSDPATGVFSASLPAGTYVAMAEAQGYMPMSITLVVEGGRAVPADFRLAAAAAAGGTLVGTVSDYETGDPIDGTITIADAGITATVTRGSFSVEVPTGSWIVKAEAAGHSSATSSATVAAGASSTINFTLRRALVQGQVMSFANIYFDSGSATLKSESYPVLDEIADLLKANTNVRVEIGGHTDSDGSESFNQDLSERRATSVRTYLTQRGVPASMLTTRGYGETSPVASNSTADGKAQNRRIEFRVL